MLACAANDSSVFWPKKLNTWPTVPTLFCSRSALHVCAFDDDGPGLMGASSANTHSRPRVGPDTEQLRQRLNIFKSFPAYDTDTTQHRVVYSYSSSSSRLLAVTEGTARAAVVAPDRELGYRQRVQPVRAYKFNRFVPPIPQRSRHWCQFVPCFSTYIWWKSGKSNVRILAPKYGEGSTTILFERYNFSFIRSLFKRSQFIA